MTQTKEDFCAAWLDAWSAQDIPSLLSFYADDVRYVDPAVPQGLEGRPALAAYLEKYFAATGRLHFEIDELWTTPKGFMCRWFASVEGEAGRLRGLDIVDIRDERITLNELYVHRL